MILIATASTAHPAGLSLAARHFVSQSPPSSLRVGLGAPANCVGQMRTLRPSSRSASKQLVTKVCCYSKGH